MKPPRPGPPAPSGEPVGDETLPSPVEAAEALQARVEELGRLVPGPKRSWSPPPTNPEPRMVPVSEAERNYLAERERRRELEEELARRPAPRSDPPTPFSVSERGLRTNLTWAQIRRYAYWLIPFALGGGAAGREPILAFLGVASAARLETEAAARRDLERRLADEERVRKDGDTKNTEDQRKLALWFHGVLPTLGVKAPLPPGEPEPEPLKMLPPPISNQVGPGAAAPIQPASPLPVPAEPN